MERMYVSDHDKNLVNTLNNLDVLKHSPRKVRIHCEDALQLASIPDREVHLIITDPP